MTSDSHLKIIETSSKEHSVVRQYQQQRKCNNCKRASDPSEWMTVDSNKPIGPGNKPGISRVGTGTRDSFSPLCIKPTEVDFQTIANLDPTENRKASSN